LLTICAAEGEMKLRARKSDRWIRSPLTIYLELAALTFAGLVILVLAERIS
jgi:hypothetical protein